MRATHEYIRTRFETFNRLCFGGELPPVEIRLSNAGRTLGMFVHPRRRGLTGPQSSERCHLIISTRLDLPENEVEDTILHEMIHYYIWFKGIRDTSPHGRAFRSKMEEINRLYGRDIRISHRSTSEQLATDRHHRNNYICVQTWHDGTHTLTVCARTFVFELHRTLSSHPRLKCMDWYWSRDSWFNRFPLSRSAKVYRLTDDDFRTYFATATPCRCDGSTFAPLPRK